MKRTPAGGRLVCCGRSHFEKQTAVLSGYNDASGGLKVSNATTRAGLHLVAGGCVRTGNLEDVLGAHRAIVTQTVDCVLFESTFNSYNVHKSRDNCSLTVLFVIIIA